MIVVMKWGRGKGDCYVKDEIVGKFEAASHCVISSLQPTCTLVILLAMS